MDTKPIEKSEKCSSSLPYPPSFIDRMMRFIQELPIPYWVTYLLLVVIQCLVVLGVAWADGSITTLADPKILFLFPAWQWIPLLIMTFLNRTARATLDSFSRLLGSSDLALAELKAKFTTMPPRGVTISGIFWIAFYCTMTIIFFHLYAVFGIGIVTQYVMIVEGLLCFAIGGVIYYHSMRQLWLVNQTVKMVKHYNLFGLDPVYSFSRLTSRTGISWMIMLILNLWLFPLNAALELTLFITSIQVVLALAAFILPLRVINLRLRSEKRRLLTENQQRTGSLLTQMHLKIDENKLEGMDQLNIAISGLTTERETLEKIPTLPWRTETLTGFLSATILPIILLVVQIIIERLMGQ